MLFTINVMWYVLVCDSQAAITILHYPLKLKTELINQQKH